jgi:hypothetical protein
MWLWIEVTNHTMPVMVAVWMILCFLGMTYSISYYSMILKQSIKTGEKAENKYSFCILLFETF